MIMRKAGMIVLFNLSLFATTTHAAHVYGTLVKNKQPSANTEITIKCGRDDVYGTKTNDRGSYSVRVGTTGECRFIVTNKHGSPEEDIFSYERPARYDFDLVRKSDGRYELKRK